MSQDKLREALTEIANWPHVHGADFAMSMCDKMMARAKQALAQPQVETDGACEFCGGREYGFDPEGNFGFCLPCERNGRRAKQPAPQGNEAKLREALETAHDRAKQLAEAARNPFGHDSHHFMALAQSVEKFTAQALAALTQPPAPQGNDAKLREAAEALYDCHYRDENVTDKGRPTALEFGLSVQRLGEALGRIGRGSSAKEGGGL